jgi:hypothetical protein
MKNVKNTLFVATAALVAGLLAALLSGCDGSVGGGDELGDAGRSDAEVVAETDAGRADSKVASCQVPAPRVSMTGVSATPRLGYVVLGSDVALTCVVDPRYQLAPATCSAPVDGFASSVADPWCCVNLKDDGKSLASSQYPLKCLPAGLNTTPGSSSDAPGDVAVCSSSGSFVGWACQGDALARVLASRTVPAVTCPIPASKRKVSGADHPPTNGYKKLVGVYGAVPCSTQPGTGVAGVDYPTDCRAPVDGFKTTADSVAAFCCVKTYTQNNPELATFNYVSCTGSNTAGIVALCTEDGIFAGWEC